MNDIKRMIHDGRLEEYRALRAEMLAIITGRIWGQAIYAVITAGILSSSSDKYFEERLIFLIIAAIPFVFYVMFREHARIRMGNYIRVFLEPHIPGMNWEEYLGCWRNKFNSNASQEWLTKIDRIRHIVSLSGLYLFVSLFAFIVLIFESNNSLTMIIGIIAIASLLLTYNEFYKLFDTGGEELESLLSEVKGRNK